ncbi:two-component system, sensor histidine kinase YesM [Paenibacillus sp. yr247]|uniref:sensor histidine kinase n=1 Tax=Paenibacillus sp. yr247 TaxID=1761880 RepID=UPI000887F840|nr:sensor histidine kinase [Paenibacillus sp. yr247]SDO78222.1 two-component system, sensor histidine kinase YesM [Paenibacillus sp. yr247]
MKRISIRLRLMVLMICLTTLPVITVTWIATDNTRNSVEKEIISANNSRLLWADQYLFELIQQIDILFYTLQINQTLMAGLNDIDSSDIGVQYRTQNYIKDTLTTTFHSNSRKVDELILYIDSNQKAVSVNFANSGIISFLDIHNGAWSRLQGSPINMYFKQSGNGIYAFHSMNRFEDRKLLGGLAVRINRDVWKEVSDILKSESESHVFLINDEGDMLSGSTGTDGSSEIKDQVMKLNLKNSDLNFLRTKSYFYFMKQVDNGKLTIVKAIPLTTISQSAQVTITAGIWTGGIFTAVSVLLSILVSLRISRPIVSLARTMRMAQVHNFEMKSVQSLDEIGLLESGYNYMMKRIKDFIEIEYQREIDVKNAQLMALQAQINPHFLNNTLHLIGGMALSKNAPEIYKITRVIGDLLRYSISSGGDMVLLEDELKHMRNYLFIQEQRFIGRCKVILSVDETALDTKLPQFILQPIVENAFEHGLQRKEGAWNVEVRVKQIGNRIILLVKDEGVGLAVDKLHEIRVHLENDISALDVRLEEAAELPRKRKGIGLKNVDTRLRLQFGNGYGVRIFSKEGAGTIVMMTLPAAKRRGGENA